MEPLGKISTSLIMTQWYFPTIQMVMKFVLKEMKKKRKEKKKELPVVESISVTWRWRDVCAGQLPLPLQLQCPLFSTLLVPLETELIKMHQWGSLVSGFQSASHTGDTSRRSVEEWGSQGLCFLPKDQSS